MNHKPIPSNVPEDPTSQALRWMRSAGAEEELLREVAYKLRRKRALRLAACTASAALVLAALVTLPLPRTAVAPAETAAPVVITTATISRPVTQALPDGSKVELKTDARIAVDYSGALRRVTLLQGEAYFQVEKDAKRPFVVQAGKLEVRAVGTAFTVQLAPKGVEVLVTEGSVQVVREAVRVNEDATTLVAAWRRCIVDTAEATPLVQEISPGDAGERLAWRIPQLEFSRTPLPEIVALMNQHASDVRGPTLELGDTAVGQIKLTGFLRADNTEGLIRLLEANFQVMVERSPARVVLRKTQ